MKKKWRVLCLVIIFSFAFINLVSAHNLDFKLFNNTGKHIAEFYLSPSSTNSWESDILKGHVIYDGDSRLITFSANDSQRAKYWVLRFVEPNGTKHIFQGIDLSSVSNLILTSNDSNIWSWQK